MTSRAINFVILSLLLLASGPVRAEGIALGNPFSDPIFFFAFVGPCVICCALLIPAFARERGLNFVMLALLTGVLSFGVGVSATVHGGVWGLLLIFGVPWVEVLALTLFVVLAPRASSRSFERHTSELVAGGSIRRNALEGLVSRSNTDQSKRWMINRGQVDAVGCSTTIGLHRLENGDATIGGKQ